jgi:hypothetical protein
MKTSNRDLLVLVKNEFLDKQEMEAELEKLNTLLHFSETKDSFCISNELLDINKHRIIDSRKEMLEISQQRILKPFRFIFNKN